MVADPSLAHARVLLVEDNRVNQLVAARMLSALFVTHALWYHQGSSIKSIAHIPDDVIVSQLRDFFLHAMRPVAAAAPHA